MAKTPGKSAKTQRQRFIEAAREVGATEDEAAFERQIKAVAGGNSGKRRGVTEDHGHDSDCALHDAPAYEAGACNCSRSRSG